MNFNATVKIWIYVQVFDSTQEFCKSYGFVRDMGMTSVEWWSRCMVHLFLIFILG